VSDHVQPTWFAEAKQAAAACEVDLRTLEGWQRSLDA
jgi:hypothetical protein